MALSDSAMRKAKPADKPIRLFDSGGLYLEISASGNKRDPCRDLRGALRPLTHAHFPSITEPVAVAELLRAIDGFKGRRDARLESAWCIVVSTIIALGHRW
jgi:hypothetical protein